MNAPKKKLAKFDYKQYMNIKKILHPSLATYSTSYRIWQFFFKNLRNLSKIGTYTTQKPLAFLGFGKI
jgi:hypothetical protein